MNRKPPGMSIDAFVERQIEEARKRGVFDKLPGHGKPLKDLDPADRDWWLRNKLRDEGLQLPLTPALELRRDVPKELDRLSRLRGERLVRAELEKLNARIRKVNSRHASGPSSNVCVVDIDEFIARWRAARG